MTDYMVQEGDKKRYAELQKEQKRLEDIQKEKEKTLKKAQEEADKNYAAILRVKQELRQIKRKMNERIRSGTMYTIDFESELKLIPPKTVFENELILDAALRATPMKVKKGLTWDHVFLFIEPMEIYVLMKTTILRQFYKDIAYAVGGSMDQDKIKDVEAKAVKKMRTQKFFENIYL